MTTATATRPKAKREPGGLYFAILAILFVVAIVGYVGGGAYLLWSHGQGGFWVVVISGVICPVPFCVWLLGSAWRYDI